MFLEAGEQLQSVWRSVQHRGERRFAEEVSDRVGHDSVEGHFGLRDRQRETRRRLPRGAAGQGFAGQAPSHLRRHLHAPSRSGASTNTDVNILYSNFF